jgi:hypothetical protein
MINSTSYPTQHIDQALDAYIQTLEVLQNALLEFEEALSDFEEKDFEENSNEGLLSDRSNGQSLRLLSVENSQA